MKAKQSIVGTFFINILVVILTIAVILLAMWLYRMMIFASHDSSFVHFLQSITKGELALIMFFSLLSTLIVSSLIAKELKAHFTLFHQHFYEASTHLKKIDTQNLQFQEFEDLAISINAMVAHIEVSKQEVLLHKSYLQAVLEAQKNIVFVMREDTITSVNRAFLDFFHMDSLDAFYNSYEKLCSLFIKEDGYLTCTYHDREWREFILENPTLVHKVKLEKEAETFIFVISITKIEDVTDRDVVVSMTDITSIEKERKLFEKAAETDALTGIANRLRFNSMLSQQIALSKRYENPFSVILFDIDDFKRVNDTYGHIVGDEVLVSLTKHVSKMIRESDIFARWGGEEFAIILPRTKEHEAYELAEKIREEIITMHFGEGFKLSCSFGVKAYHDSVGKESFMQEVDVLLYKAKRDGKNRVCV